MPNINTNLLWGLVCALALVVGLIAGRMGLDSASPMTILKIVPNLGSGQTILLSNQLLR